MASKQRTTKKRSTTTRRKKPTKAVVKRQMTGNIIGLVGVLITVFAFWQLGLVGNFFAECFRLVAGNASPLLAGLTLLIMAYLMIFGHWPKISWRWWTGGNLIIFSYLLLLEIPTFNQLNRHTEFLGITWRLIKNDFATGGVSANLGGGLVGALGYSITYPLLANLGTILIAIILIITGIFIAFNLPFHETMQAVRHGLLIAGDHVHAGYEKVSHYVRVQIARWRVKQQLKENQQAESQPTEPTETNDTVPTSTAPTPVPPAPVSTAPISAAPADDMNITVASDNEKSASAAPETSAKDADDLQGTEVADESDYQLPTADLLTKIPKTDQSAEYATIESNSQKLKTTLASFGVQVEVKHVSLGPSVTKYELHPAVGVKVSKVVNLADDLALALAAKDLRIEAPIPGKSLIGIEVPNKQISTVAFRDIVEAQPAHPTKPLEVPLGRDVSGNLVTADLSKMPHLLIAGSTGSGKSVAINVMTTGLLMNTKPNQVKFMLIDPKKVELGIYNGIPHLLTPVVTEPKKAARALHKVVAEMERRYELFADSHQRNMQGYNQYIRQQNSQDGQNRPVLPYIVVIVDELADLMMVTSSEVEDAIIRLGQMARAAGIHMILATQRPSVDVITGLIKANVPSRMAFAVSSGTDSRTIIDSNGAEKLLGRGDMLYQPMGMNKPLRVQGAYISDHDVEEVVNFIKDQQTADYDDSMLVKDDEADSGNGGDPRDGEDEYYADAVELVTEQQSASVSMLQRRFRIGYNRAARIVDEMEERGVVGPSEGSKPRKVYRQPSAEEPPSSDGPAPS
ncbi:cell division protein FtsK [Lactiplantibacillus fabifermentans T30PCM01]|uniref:Cell division protein FtsK n=1 Tax=Lactiplantibacillus fabifermentans T30PCM01 TaxID=1400520 RepID=W6T6U8_9LACO|nr:DNA translocase FtsK [Lactiplantibacillus fabifermentans]ETY73942.1 cell division protein FtsK [Lactiplantibacillus fabifermentans T30PCM01]